MNNFKRICLSSLVAAACFGATVQTAQASLKDLGWNVVKKLGANLVSDFLLESTSGSKMTDKKASYLERRADDLNKQLDNYRNEPDYESTKKMISSLQIALDRLDKLEGRVSVIEKDLIILKSMVASNYSHVSNLGSKKYNHGVYVGALKNGQPNGHGTFYYYDGDKFEGTYQAGKRKGCGLSTFKSGYSEKKCYSYGRKNYNQGVYKGEMLNGKPHGEGTFLYSETKDKYEGIYSRGKRDGIGIHYLNSGGKKKQKYDDGELLD